MEKQITYYIRKIVKTKTGFTVSIPKNIVDNLQLEGAKVKIIELDNCIIIEKLKV